MDVRPRTVAAGGAVTITRARDETRGMSYNLLGIVGGEWVLLYLLYPARERAPAEAKRVRAGERIMQPAIAILGGAPEEVQIPADAPPGSYRIAASSDYVEIAVKGRAG